MICGLCQNEVPKFVKSHIIPKAIFIDGLNDDEHLAIASTNLGNYPKKSWDGIYSEIVCTSCEQTFHGDDEFLINFIRHKDSHTSLFQEDPDVAIQYPNINGNRLLRSILSVLFRAHLSTHYFFKKINLGPHAEPLRQFIYNDASKPPEAFGIALRYLSTNIGGVVHCPIHEKHSGINHIRFYFPFITAIIIVDKRKHLSPYKDLEIGAGNIVTAMKFDRFSPSESNVIRKVVGNNGSALNKMFGKFNKPH